MSMRRKSKAAPENINEEYYQISTEILTSFSKYRPPVDLFRFREDIASLAPYSRKGQRLTNEQVEEARVLCEEGSLFVSRSDHPIYSEHIVKQLDLVLQDPNFKESEVADICTRALVMRLDEFIQQPVRPIFDVLYKDCMVVTQWLWEDRHRIKNFMRRLFRREHTLATHSFNTMAVGLWLRMSVCENEYRRRDLDRTTLALLLHDIGMAKIPRFILDKPAGLKTEEREKVLMHPLLGYKMLQRVDLKFDELTQATLEHHERLDGSGYPQRIKGEQISRLGRITALADSFAAMISNRPYAPGKEPMEALKELMLDRGRYDFSLVTPLAGAYASNQFGEMRVVSLAPEAPAAASAGE